MKKQFLFNPNNPKKSFDVYIDKNINDTIDMKYSSVKDVKDYINKLESLYKQNKYNHSRISKNAMILRVRLRIINENTNKGKERLKLITRYTNFLKRRTRIKDEKERKKLTFKI